MIIPVTVQSTFKDSKRGLYERLIDEADRLKRRTQQSFNRAKIAVPIFMKRHPIFAATISVSLLCVILYVWIFFITYYSLIIFGPGVLSSLLQLVSLVFGYMCLLYVVGGAF